MPPEYGGLSATAEVVIYEKGEEVHRADIPWATPIAEVLLAMQVYLLSQMPNYPDPEWQPVMEAFAFACEDFSPPEKIWWSTEPLFD